MVLDLLRCVARDGRGRRGEGCSKMANLGVTQILNGPYFWICLDRFSENSIFQFLEYTPTWPTIILGHGSHDVNTFYRNFFWLKCKVTNDQLNQLTNELCAKFHSEVNSIVIMIYLIKPFMTIKFCIMSVF